MWSNELYPDVASIPIYIIILFTTIYRRMTRGRSNILFLWVVTFAFLTAVSDLAAGICMGGFPMPDGRVKLLKVIEYVYFIMRHGTNVLYFFYVVSVTRTWRHIQALWKKLLILTPYLGILALLASNELTSALFTVTPAAGYARGESILILYVLAFMYLLLGVTCLVLCRRILEPSVWLPLFAVYPVNLAAIGIQLVRPGMLVECYFTSITLLFAVLFIQRPEKQVDADTGLLSYQAFREEMGKIKAAGQDVQIVLAGMKNADEMLRCLGDKAYSAYIHSIGKEIAACAKREKLGCELYFEPPGHFYIIIEDVEYNPVQAIPDIRDRVVKARRKVMETGALTDMKIVTVRFPEEIRELDELFRFGHNFVRFANVDRLYSRVSEILRQKPYQVETHLDEMLNRAVERDGLRISYEPVWSAKEERFLSAEAVVRLDDEVYGEIDADLLLGAAEEQGAIIRLGSYLLDRVFSFVGENNLPQYGYLYIVIGLSPVQYMKMDFPDQVWELREKYGVHPEQICFAIRESVYGNISGVLDENLRKLSVQGYRLTLDGYGKGYTNLQRILELPIESVRLDRSLVLGATSDEGRALLQGNIRMLQAISLKVVAREANDEATASMLLDMGCEKLQGRYFAQLQKEYLYEDTNTY